MKKALFFIASVFIAFSGSAQQPIGKAFLLGKASYTTDTSFVKVPAAYTNKETYLKKAAYNAFLKMREAAAKDAVKLRIVSGFRSFDYQNGIWNRKWNNLTAAAPKLPAKQKVLNILTYSAMPGASRHHWGTDMDLNSTTPADFDKPEYKRLYAWLVNNAAKYGFYQPYTAGRASGYKEEKWHWSYRLLSKIYLAEYVKQVTYPDLVGVRGSEVASQIGIIQNWVLGVNPQCR